jgi:O-antigen ligase
MPFKEDVGEAEDLTTSNPIRQIIFSSIYLLAFISLVPSFEKLFKILKEEKFLLTFLIWALISMFWSNYPDVTFKRWMQIFGAYIVISSAMIYLKNPDELLKIFKWVLYFYIILSFFSVFTIPGATMSYQGELVWRGLAPHKNQLGQIALVSALMWIFSLTQKKSKYVQIDLLMLLISIILLLGSKSTTSLLVLFFLIVTILLSNTIKRLNITGITKWFVTILLFTFFAVLVSSLILFPEIIDQFFSVTGKDPTFTGRTDLWVDVLDYVSNQIIYGVGYGAFWVIGSSQMNLIYAIYIWLPQQSHNGYIDVIIETGLIGLFLLVGMILTYFLKNNRYKLNQFWKYFVITAILLNFQESSFFRTNSMVGILFIFSYLALNSEVTLRKNDN